MCSVTVTFEAREHWIRADPSLLREAREFAAAAAAEYGLDGDSSHGVKVAMSEAVTNAIQHGCSSPDDRVRLTVTEESGALVFYVRDTGRFTTPAPPSGDLDESGRGLEFMRLLMDEVEVIPSADGTTLRFSKRR